MLYVKGEVFIRVSLVRVRAEVAGYLTDNVGILEYVVIRLRMTKRNY